MNHPAASGGELNPKRLKCLRLPLAIFVFFTKTGKNKNVVFCIIILPFMPLALNLA